ncbi:MAG: glycoside hydrolase family 99-like domain-containing protein [Nitrososphaeria archaeon]
MIFEFICLTKCIFAQSNCPLIGAIRWDAWHGEKGKVGSHVEKVLSSPKWRYRLPFCSKVIDGRVTIDCSNPKVIQEEIHYARRAKLDYWAFLFYEPESEMNLQLNLYLNSPDKSLIKFAIILQPGRLNPQNFKEINSYIVRLIKNMNYLQIDGKPVIFIFNITKWKDRISKVWNEIENFRSQALGDLTKKIVSIAGSKPYYVIMEFNPERAAFWADLLGLDAITAYATHPDRPGKFEDLARHTINYWEIAKNTGKTVIPIVMMGWDPRPRVEYPAPWQNRKYIEKAEQVYFTPPTSEELKEYLQKSIKWAIENKSPAILIYAWNEFDEGGWLMPTLSEGNLRIEALREVIVKECVNER